MQHPVVLTLSKRTQKPFSDALFFHTGAFYLYFLHQPSRRGVAGAAAVWSHSRFSVLPEDTSAGQVHAIVSRRFHTRDKGRWSQCPLLNGPHGAQRKPGRLKEAARRFISGVTVEVVLGGRRGRAGGMEPEGRKNPPGRLLRGFHGAAAEVEGEQRGETKAQLLFPWLHEKGQLSVQSILQSSAIGPTASDASSNVGS